MGYEELAERLAGVVAITVTPFDEAGALAESTYAALVDRLVSGGIPVVTPNGNTSEFYALSPAETRLAVDITVDAVGGRASVLCGVGQDLETAVAGARYAAAAGADGIMVHQPVHPYVSLDGWVEYHRVIASAVQELGVVLYLRNIRIGGQQLRELKAKCPNVVGVKYAVPDPVRFASVARDAGVDQFTWVAGLAELSAPGYWAAGARGFTSGLANVSPELSLSMYEALSKGDLQGAMEVWERIRPFEELRAAGESADNVAVVKEALAQLGLCRRDVRPPSHPLKVGARTEIGHVLSSWGLRGAP